MKFKPREYQIQIKKDLYKKINQGAKKVVIVAPTGSGKTWISTNIINDAVSRNRKVLFLIHRDVLAEQTAKTLEKSGLNCGFIMGSKKANPSAQIQVASVQTLARRKLDFEPDLIFYDECHLTAYTTIGKKFLTELKDVWHVGLTATPWRLKKTEGLGDLFDDLVVTPMPYELMDMGYLVRPRYFVLEKPDTKGVRTTAGDFNLADLSIVCNQENVINNLVENWLNVARNRKTIVFAVNVDHAKAIATAFNSQGIRAEAVYGDMSIKEREVIYEHLKTGQIEVITSCEALAEGFDVPSIDCVVLARPTKSKAKYFQQVGRGLRISPNKSDCLVLDQAGLVENFDPIEDLRSYTLENGKEKKTCSNFCEKCGRGTLPNLTLCPRCMESAEKEKILPIGIMKELIISKGKKREFEWYRKRLQMAYFQGYSPGWAMMKFNDHYGYFPDGRWGIGAVFGETPSQSDKDKYIEHLIFIAVKNQKSRKWIEKQYFLEFGSYPSPERLLLLNQLSFQLSLDIGEDL